MGKIVVVGSLAYDSVKTPMGQVDGALGGSANYFGLSASQFAPVQVVGVVGSDYRQEDINMLNAKGVDTRGMQKVSSGKTFRWAGEYGVDMNEAKTLKTDLNVFEKFKPELPAEYRKSEYVFLANIDPELQLDVLNQIEKPRLVAADTMNFWIQSKLDTLLKVLKKIDILLINEGESKLLTSEMNAISAAKKLSEMGPKGVVIKRGEYGFVLYAENRYFALPAFPVSKVVDPTGAGDTFAGGFMGYLAKFDLPASSMALRMASVFGTIMASFTVQDFSVEALKNLTYKDVERRHLDYSGVVSMSSN